MVVAAVAAEDVVAEPAVARTAAESAERLMAMRPRAVVAGAAAVVVAVEVAEVTAVVAFLRGERLDCLRWMRGWRFGEGKFSLIPVYFYGRTTMSDFQVNTVIVFQREVRDLSANS